MPEQEVSKEEFKQLYFKYALPGSGWTEDYWNNSFETETGKQYFFSPPTSPFATQLLIVTDDVKRRMFFFTEESTEDFFEFPGKGL